MTNLAYDLREEQIKKPMKKVVRRTKSRARVQNNIGQKIAIRAVLFLAFCGVVALNILNNYSNLANVKNSIEVKKRENIRLEKEVKLIEARLEEIASSTKIEEIASEKLGMIYPSEENKIYINSREQEYAKEKPKKEIGFMGLFTK